MHGACLPEKSLSLGALQRNCFHHKSIPTGMHLFLFFFFFKFLDELIAHQSRQQMQAIFLSSATLRRPTCPMFRPRRAVWAGEASQRGYPEGQGHSHTTAPTPAT